MSKDNKKKINTDNKTVKDKEKLSKFDKAILKIIKHKKVKK